MNTTIDTNTSTLSDEELKELKRKAFNAMSHSRHVLLSKYPFIGSIALRMELVPIRDVRVSTACTDGNSIFADIAFLSSLSQDERTFVLAHEIWHAVLIHLTRRGTRNPALFNIASDKEVNYLLKSDGFIPPTGLCFPEDDEIGKSAEEIYEMMLKKMKNQQQQQGNSQNEDSSDSATGSSKGRKSGKPNKNNKSNNNEHDDEPSNGSSKLSGQFDKHLYDNSVEPTNDADSNGEGGNGIPEIHDKYGKVGLDPDFKPSISKDFADRMRETVISEAQRCEKTRGTLPNHIKELVKKLMTPEIKWQEVLAQFVTKCYNSGARTWIPPNRRHIHNDIYLQSRQASKIKLAVGIDTSGSTYGDRSKFLTELHSLIKSFGNFDLHIIECDCEVGAYKHYTQDDDLESIIDNNEYTMSGGGGTAMAAIYDYILDNQIECDAIVIMTDGYIDNIPKNPIPSLPTLWVITKDGTENFCNWGQKIKLKNSDVE